MAEHMTGSEILLKALNDQGVEVVFGYPGGAVLPIYDELFKQNKIKHVLVRHEQGAVHAAEGYARSTGKVGCVLVTSGPGATNAVTGLTDALMDSIPVVCFTGQVPTQLIGNDAFQEADTTGITRSCTKHNYLIKDVNTFARKIHEAFYVAASGRPGPVVVDLPKDILIGSGPYVSPAQVKHKSYKPQVKGELKKIEEAASMLAKAKKPILYAGGGVINSGPAACQLLTQFARTTGVPVTLTLMGLGAYPASDPQFLGMLGMHGTYEANLAMHQCDVMLCVGARFDDRVTGRLDAFAPDAEKIHIDIDPSSINKNVMVDLGIVGDVAHVLEDLTKVWKAKQYRIDTKALKGWWEQIEEWRAVECLKFDQGAEAIKPQQAIRRFYELTKDKGKEVFVSTEVGQHQMWVAQHFPFDKPNHWMTSGGLGTMGYGFPSAMGVQMAHPDAIVVGFAGDASFQMNVQEMSTVAQYRLPVKILVLNNQYMGMVRQWQELIYGGRYSESYTDSQPDFIKLAEAYGWKGIRVKDPADLDAAIEDCVAYDGPVLMDVVVDPSENCYPMIMSGSAHNEMLLGPEDDEDARPDENGMVLV